VPAVNLIPAEVEVAPTSKANRAFDEHQRRAAAGALFQRDTPPANIIGGYRFLRVPEVDLGPTSVATPTAPATLAIGDGLAIPDFLKRTVMEGR
jgi:hypothetical protein